MKTCKRGNFDTRTAEEFPSFQIIKINIRHYATARLHSQRKIEHRMV
jgi:hypothetical protein